jgi:hypothetical protein
VDRPRQPPLAGPGLANDQHRGGARRHPARHGQDVVDLRRVGGEFRIGVVVQVGPDRPQLRPEPAPLGHPAEHQFDGRRCDRRRQVVDRAVVDGLQRPLGLGPRGNTDHVRRGGVGEQLANGLPPDARRGVEREADQVGRLAVQLGAGGGDRGDHGRAVTVGPEVGSQARCGRGVGLHDQHVERRLALR